MTKPTETPEAGALLYITAKPNTPLTLYEGTLTFDDGREKGAFQGQVVLEWMPSPGIYVQAEMDGTAGPRMALKSMVSNDMFKVSFPAAQGPALCSLSSINGQRLRTHLTGSVEIGDGSHLFEAHLYAINLRDYHCLGPDNRYSRSTVASNDEWCISLEPAHNRKELHELLDSRGGYGITHLLRIRRTDKQPFASDRLGELHTMLFFLLSFMEGRIVSPVLPVGLDAAGNKCWSTWALWRNRSWITVQSWVDPHHGEVLTHAFPGFAKKWNDSGWREAFRTAIQCYAHANRNDADLDTGIVLAVMCLDTLAWHRLVNADKMLTKKAFKKLTAADRIRILCVLCKVPLDFHVRSMELKQLAKAKQWHDTADAVVGVRNNIVHPDNDLTVKGVNYHQTILQAWICAMWICEAVILSLIEYSGPYSDRRTYPKYVGTLDRLPWV